MLKYSKTFQLLYVQFCYVSPSGKCIVFQLSAVYQLHDKKHTCYKDDKCPNTDVFILYKQAKM